MLLRSGKWRYFETLAETRAASVSSAWKESTTTCGIYGAQRAFLPSTRMVSTEISRGSPARSRREAVISVLRVFRASGLRRHRASSPQARI